MTPGLLGKQTPGGRQEGTTIANIIELVTSQLGSGGLGAVAARLGIGEDKAQGAVQTALSVLTGAMARNASRSKGAAALNTALERDHDGGIFDRLGDFIGDAGSGPGAAILGHVLGKKGTAVTGAIGQQTGLSQQQSGNLLVTLAPLLMGALGKMKREQGLDASGVAGALAGQTREIQQSAPSGLSSLLGMVGGGDGAAELLGKGTSLLKGMFGSRK